VKNVLVEGREVAPPNCIVCGKDKPGREPDGEDPPGWTYLSDSVRTPHARPIGAISCSTSCTEVAIRRYRGTGRVDTPEMRVV
jgi:hypothetical protein